MCGRSRFRESTPVAFDSHVRFTYDRALDRSWKCLCAGWRPPNWGWFEQNHVIRLTSKTNMCNRNFFTWWRLSIDGRKRCPVTWAMCTDTLLYLAMLCRPHIPCAMMWFYFWTLKSDVWQSCTVLRNSDVGVTKKHIMGMNRCSF